MMTVQTDTILYQYIDIYIYMAYGISAKSRVKTPESTFLQGT